MDNVDYPRSKSGPCTASSAPAAAVAAHLHAAGLAAFPEIRLVQLVLTERISPAVRQLEVDRLSLVT